MLDRFRLALCPLALAACTPTPTEADSTDGASSSTDGGSDGDPDDGTATDRTDGSSAEDSGDTDGVDDTNGTDGTDATDGTDDTGGPLADCGNGIVEGDELCDAPNDPDVCTESCAYVPGAVVWEVSEGTWIPKGLTVHDERVWISGSYDTGFFFPDDPPPRATVHAVNYEGGVELSTMFLDDATASDGAAIAVDDEGRVFIGGARGESGSTALFPLHATLWRLETDSALVWERQVSPNLEQSFSIVRGLVAVDDGVVLGASFAGGANVDWAVQERDIDGELVFEDLDTDASAAQALVLDADGSLLVGGSDGFGGVVVRYAPDGTRLWTADLSSAILPLTGVAVREDVIVVVGGDEQGRVTTISPSGEPQWSKPVALEEPGGVAIDADGNFDVVGRAIAPSTEMRVLEVDGEPWTADESDAGFEVPLWSYTWELEGTGHGSGLTIDAQGRVFAIGWLEVIGAPDVTAGVVVQLGG